MSFRKRNVVIGSSGPSTPVARQEKSLAPGTRPSPLDGRPTTSTGTQSLDQLLAGHAGIPMGTSLLIEETGTTDFGGVLLRYYGAEGLVQGHHVHLLGFNDSWRRELPGLGKPSNSKSSKATPSSDDKMKIAWRYETLAQRNVPVRGKFTTIPDLSCALCRNPHHRLTTCCRQTLKLHWDQAKVRASSAIRLISPNALIAVLLRASSTPRLLMAHWHLQRKRRLQSSSQTSHRGSRALHPRQFTGSSSRVSCPRHFTPLLPANHEKSCNFCTL